MRRTENKRIKNAAAALAFLFILSLLSACNGGREASVVIAGSTSVQPYAEILAEEYSRQRPDKVIEIQAGGSSAGIMAVESGIAHLGMSSRNLKENEWHLWKTEIAKDGLAIIVHPNNPVTDVTLSELQDIYTGTITHWSQLGGAHHRIHIIAREEGSGTRSAFDDLVMEKNRVTNRAIIQNTNGSVRQLVSLDEYAIGFISLGLADDTVQAVRIDGVAATWDNVQQSFYRLYRPFLFVCAHAPEDKAKGFVDFALSPEGQQILINEGLIPANGEGFGHE
jgi:phosphate transport system substrate-binding protein